MRLNEYLSKNEKSQATFAKDIEESPQNVNRYVKGERIPEQEVMLKIFDATGGAVTANDFYDLPEKPNGKNHG